MYEYMGFFMDSGPSPLYVIKQLESELGLIDSTMNPVPRSLGYKSKPSTALGLIWNAVIPVPAILYGELYADFNPVKIGKSYFIRIVTIICRTYSKLYQGYPENNHIKNNL